MPLDLGIRLALTSGVGALALLYAPPAPAAPPAPTGTIYYVDNAGNDANNGTSQATPWQTLNQMYAVTLNPGDAVYFKGGQTFSTPNGWYAGTSGTQANPITIGSYGTGRATIQLSANDYAMRFADKSGWVVRDLMFTLAGGVTSTVMAISISSVTAACSYFWIWNCDATGFKQGIIAAGDANSAASYVTDIVVYGGTYSAMSDAGISASSALAGVVLTSVKPNKRVSVYGATVHHCGGDGIVLGAVDTASITRCVSHHIGLTSSGRVGQWLYSVDNGTIRYGESYSNATTGATDGGGFDLDGACRNCIMEWNYSHDNAGGGLMVFPYVNSGGVSNCIIRYNISQNDGSSNTYAGLHLTNPNGDRITGIYAYGNTVFNNNVGQCLIAGPIGTGDSVRIFDNIFVGNGTAHVANVLGAVTATSGLVLSNNVYFGSGNFIYNGGNYATYALWRAAVGALMPYTENYPGADSGSTADPKLNNPGAAGTLGGYSPTALKTYYGLQASSPEIGVGTRPEDIVPAVLLTQFPATYDAFMFANASNRNIGADLSLFPSGTVATSLADATSVADTLVLKDS